MVKVKLNVKGIGPNAACGCTPAVTGQQAGSCDLPAVSTERLGGDPDTRTYYYVHQHGRAEAKTGCAFRSKHEARSNAGPHDRFSAGVLVAVVSGAWSALGAVVAAL